MTKQVVIGVAMVVILGWAAMSSAATPAALGTGSLAVRVASVTGGVEVDLDVDLAGIAAVVVGNPGGENLVAVEATAAPTAARDVVALVRASARATVEAADLRGFAPSLRVPADGAALKGIELSLVRGDGSVVRFAVTGDVLGTRATFTFAGTDCPTVRIKCAGGCNAETTCCAQKLCWDCIACRLTCGKLGNEQ